MKYSNTLEKLVERNILDQVKNIKTIFSNLILIIIDYIGIR